MKIKIAIYFILTMGIATCLYVFSFRAKSSLPYLPEGDKYDLGVVEEGKTASHSFPICNKGSAPLVIKKIIPSCSCTKAEVESYVINPGESKTVSVFYTGRNVDGYDLSEVKVVTNSEKTPIITLLVKASIKTKIFWKPESVSINKNKKSGDVLFKSNFAKQFKVESYKQTNNRFITNYKIVSDGILFSFAIDPNCSSGNWIEKIKIDFLIDDENVKVDIPVYILNK